MTKALRILLADDHDIVRSGLRALIEPRSDWKIVAEAKNGRDAVLQAKRTKPDVIILDLTMPLLDGLAATRQIVKIMPQAKVLILTMHDTESSTQAILEAGARGYVLKSDAGLELISAIDALSRGRTYFTSKLTQHLLDEFLRKDEALPKEPSRSKDPHLTAQQIEILKLLAEGKSTPKIAAILKLKLKTAEGHRAHMMRILGCQSLADLIRYAVRNRIVKA
jgi:DNA-binding NarL/FixJ family response regulator